MIITPKVHSRSRISCDALCHAVTVRIAVSYSEGTTFESLSEDGLS